MKLRKRLGALMLGASMLLTMALAVMPGQASAAGTGSIVLTINMPTMLVNGVTKNIDDVGSKATLDKGGYTMLPLRGIVEAMGGTLTWDAKTRTITMMKDNQTIQLTVGSTKANVGGTEKDMLAGGSPYKAPYIGSTGRTLVHVRALELFPGTTCTWDQAKQQVTVSYVDNAVPQLTSKNYRVDVINKTNSDVTNLRYAQAGSYQYTQQNALSGTVAKNGGTGSFYVSIPDTGTTRVYDFYTEGSGGTRIYSGLNFNNVNAYVTLVLKEGQTFEQINDSAVKATETELTFKNNSSRDVEELYMSKSSDFSDADNLLAAETVKSKKSTTIKINLDGTKTWYFKAVNEKGKEFSDKVTFESETVKTATLSLTSSEKISLSRKNDGDISIALINNTDQRIYHAFLVEKGEGKDFDLDDHDEENDLLEGDRLSSYSQIVIEDAADSERYDLVLFYDTGDRDCDYITIDLGKASSYAAIYIDRFSSKRFSGSSYHDEDDTMIVGIYNDTDENLSSVEVREYRSNKSIKSVGSIKDGETVYIELNVRDYPDINISWSGNSDGVDVEDVDDEEAFAYITLKSKSRADIEGIDDL